MKIYTENDVKQIVLETLQNDKYAVSLPLTKEGLQSIVNSINKLYGMNMIVDSDMTCVNDVIEAMNNEKGLGEYTIRDFFEEICSDNRNDTAIIFDGISYTYDELYNNVLKLSVAFSKLNIHKGSKVALILQNRIEYIFLYFALFYIGAYPVPINTRWGKQEVYNVLDDSKVQVIVTEEKIGSLTYGQYIEEYIERDNDVQKVIYFSENLYKEKGIAYENFIDVELRELNREEIYPDDIAMLSYTSGTTGTPKGVMLKNNDIVKISVYTTQTWENADEDYPISIAPLYSAQGFLSLFINFSLGKTFKMLSSFNPNDILQEISKNENTVIHTQPTMWSLLLNCRIINFTNFESLSKLVVSGSLCSPELARQIEEKIGCVLLNAYGLIESTSVVTMTRPDDPYDVRMNTVGRVIPGIKIKIVDENKQEVSHGEIGELAVKGYNMAGYYNNPDKTNEVLTSDGWLYTGDLAKYYDEENICIVGRCKDMIIRGGFNVYPSDIEEYILQIEGVQNVAVVGKTNSVLGEEIVAFILPKAGVEINKNTIIKTLFGNLANYKMPDKIYFVSEIPTILAGKIDKKELKKWAEEGIPEDKQMTF